MRSQNLKSFSFPLFWSVRCRFLSLSRISFAIMSEKSSRLAPPGTPAEPRETAS